MSQPMSQMKTPLREVAFCLDILVGARGFEPPTSRSRTLTPSKT